MNKSLPTTWTYPNSEDGTRCIGFDNTQAIESNGLRFTGYADEVYDYINHKGWYNDEECPDEVVRGIVVQLPSKNGELRYLAGADWSGSDLCFVECDILDSLSDAAIRANGIAQFAADEEKEYRVLDRANMDREDKRDEIRAIGERINVTVKARRESVDTPITHGILSSLIEEYVAEIQGLRANIEALEDIFDFSTL